MAQQRNGLQSRGNGAYFSPLGLGGPPTVPTRNPLREPRHSPIASLQGSMNSTTHTPSLGTPSYQPSLQMAMEDEVVFDSQPSGDTIDLNSQQPSSMSFALLDASLRVIEGGQHLVPSDASLTIPQQPSQPKRRGRPPANAQGKDKPSTGRFHWDATNTDILIESKK